jgi:hypothetical protein
MIRLAFKGWTYKSPQSTRPTPPFFPEFTSPSSHGHGHAYGEEVYGHGLEQDLSHLRDLSDSSDTTIKADASGGTVRSRALSF